MVYDKLSKITHFVVITEKTLAERLVWLFKDNIWKIHKLLESMMLSRELQFVIELTKELNNMLRIETKLLTALYSQIDGQIERINQKLEQYLRFFVDHRQKDWPEWLMLAEFTVNNKIHLTMKISSFIANYGRKL